MEHEMIPEALVRTAMLLGEGCIGKLASAHIAIFGIGGVGGHAAEALVRSGIGELTLIDGDTVAESNLNRQLFATLSTVGMPKTEAAVKRLSDISTTCKLHPIQQFVTAEDVEEMDFSHFDLVIDAIDTVSSKLAIIKKCDRLGIPAISAMGAGNKLDPTRFEVADIYETSVCPLAAAVRRECRKAGVKGLRVVYSREEAIKPHFIPESESESRRLPPASSAFVPSVSGLIIAGEAVKILTDINRK